MERVVRPVLAGLVGFALASSSACGSRQSLSSPTGLGGAAGASASGTGGSQTTGTGAARADGGRVGLFDGGGDADVTQGVGPTETTCVGDGGWPASLDAGGAAGDAGICDTLPADPPAFPWSQPHVGARDGGSADSGCQTTSVSGQTVDVACSGAAWLRAVGSMTANGQPAPTLTWDDGSSVAWDPTGLDPSIPAPIAEGGADQRVWAELESHGWLAVPGQCGWSWDQTMELRDSAGGAIRLLARQGASVAEPDSAELAALFGVDARATTFCTHDALGGPALFRQTLHDHQLATDPPQVIPYAQPTRVTTPNGTFQVLWYSRSQVARPLSTTCAGCLNQGPIVGLVASRIAAP